MIIGVTGGIGSGKSYICKTIGYKCGILYVDSDSIVKDTLMYYIPIATQVVKAFGEDSYMGGKLNRNKFYNVLYANRNNLITMNNIVVPYLIDYIKDISSRNKNIILECPIIFDTDIHKIVDFTILVKSDMNLRIKRLMERYDSLELIKNKIESQSFDDSKANYIINNDKTIELQIDKMISQMGLSNLSGDINLKEG